MKTVTALAAAILALGIAGSPEAEAGKKGRNIATGIIVGIGAATLLGAAAQAAREDQQDEYYSYDDDYDPRQNAVAACLHRAHRALRSRGAEGTELRRVRDATEVGEESVRVSLSLNAYYDGEPDRVNVQCRVFRDQVTRFRISG